MLGRLDPQTVGRENDRFLQEIFSIFCCDSHHEASQQNSFYSRPLKITGTSVSSQKENKERWGIILNHFLSTNHPMLATNQRKKRGLGGGVIRPKQCVPILCMDPKTNINYGNDCPLYKTNGLSLVLNRVIQSQPDSLEWHRG